MERLTPREENILYMRDDLKETYEQIGEQLGITRERVRQIYKKASIKENKNRELITKHIVNDICGISDEEVVLLSLKTQDFEDKENK